MNATAIASAGVLSGLVRFDAASAALSRAFDPGSSVNVAGAIVDQTSAAQQMQASAATLRASDQMLKQLLDITV